MDNIREKVEKEIEKIRFYVDKLYCDKGEKYVLDNMREVSRCVAFHMKTDLASSCYEIVVGKQRCWGNEHWKNYSDSTTVGRQFYLWLYREE